MPAYYGFDNDVMRREAERLHKDRGTSPPYTTFNTPDANVVRAQFKPGGPLYTYRCTEDVALGDIIQAPGNSSATVRALGVGTYKGPIKTAVRIRTRDDENDRLRRSAADSSAAAWRDALYKDNPLVALVNDAYGHTNRKETPAMNPTCDRIENAETELKAARKAAKLAKKHAREVAAAAKERADRRALAFAALENVAQHGGTFGSERTAAALSLLDRA